MKISHADLIFRRKLRIGAVVSIVALGANIVGFQSLARNQYFNHSAFWFVAGAAAVVVLMFV